MTKLFVGGVPYSMSNEQLGEMFAKFGTVQSAKIITDNFSGNSKGFAFVEMSTDSEAREAIKNLDGFAIEGRKIGVSVAKPREDNRNKSFSRGNSGRSGGNNFLRGSYRR